MDLHICEENDFRCFQRSKSLMDYFVGQWVWSVGSIHVPQFIRYLCYHTPSNLKFHNVTDTWYLYYKFGDSAGQKGNSHVGGICKTQLRNREFEQKTSTAMMLKISNRKALLEISAKEQVNLRSILAKCINLILKGKLGQPISKTDRLCLNPPTPQTHIKKKRE